MRVLVLVKASEESEKMFMPSKDLVADMGKFNDELVKAGVMLAADGLHPSSKGKRVRFDGSKKTVIDGPFAETKELIAGFWLWQVKSKEEAIEWLNRAPFDGGAEVVPAAAAVPGPLAQAVKGKGTPRDPPDYRPGHYKTPPASIAWSSRRTSPAPGSVSSIDKGVAPARARLALLSQCVAASLHNWQSFFFEEG